METDPPASRAAAGFLRRGGRWSLVLVAVVVGLEVLYLFCANVFLSTSLADRAINRKPEKMLVAYESAWSPWPGELRIRGFDLRGQSRRVQWIATADRVTGRIDLLALLGKRFEASDVEGRGVRFRLRRRADRPRPKEAETGEAAPAAADGEAPTEPTAEGAPPIPGLENPPEPAPGEVYPPLDPDRRRWSVLVAGLDLRDVSEIWVGGLRLRGEMAVGGGFELRLKHTTQVLPSRLVLRGARLSLDERPIADALEGDLRLASERFDHTEHRGWDALPFLSADAELAAHIAGLGFLNEILLPSAGVRFADGAGTLRLDARLREGRLTPESRLRAASPAVAVGFLDYTARGGGEVAFDVGDETSRLAAKLDSYRVTRDGYEGAHVRGSDLAVTVENLGTGLPPSIEHARVRVEIPPAEVPDLTFYNAYLPPAAGLEIRSGRGTIEGLFEARPAAGTGSGELTLTTDNLAARLRGTSLTGRVELEARFPSVDLEARRFHLAGTRVTARDVRVRGEAGGRPWAGWVKLRDGLLSPGAPVLLQGQAAGAITDVRPLLALTAVGDRLPGWILDVLGIDDVQARTGFEVGDRVRLRGLVAQADELRLRGDLALGQGDRRGRLLLSYEGFDLGFDLTGGSTDLKLLGAREWFEGRSRRRNGTADPPRASPLSTDGRESAPDGLVGRGTGPDDLATFQGNFVEETP
jgi:hypothetical protein